MGNLPEPAPGGLHRGVRRCPSLLPLFSFWTFRRYSGFVVQDYNLRSDALDALHLRRYCCRRMLLTHVDLIEKLYVALTLLFFELHLIGPI